MQKKAFFKSSLSYSIGIFGSKVILFILVPIYSFFLSKEELGEYDLLLVTITFLTPLITIQLADAVYRFLLQAQDNRSKIITTGLKLLIFGYLLFIFLTIILNIFFKYEHYLEFISLQLSSCLFIFFQQVLRGLGKNKLYAFMGVANAILVTGLSTLFLMSLDMRVDGIIIALFISQMTTITIVIITGKLYKEIDLFGYSKSLAKSMINYSWPLLPNAVSWWLIDLGNRYIILFFLNEEYNGIYAIAARYAGIIALVNSVFILSWQDFAIKDKEKEDVSKDKASLILNRFMAFELTAIIILTASAKFLVGLTTDSKYHDASNYLPILFLSAGISAFCAYFGAFYLKGKDTKGVFTTTLMGGIVNILISVILINNFGLYAVAIGSLAGFFTTLLLRMNKFKLFINYNLFFVCIVTYCIVLSLQYFDSFQLSLGLIVFSILFFLFINKKLLYSLIH